MHLVVVHKLSNQTQESSDSLLRLAFSRGPIRDSIIGRLSEWSGFKTGDFLLAVPDEWKGAVDASGSEVFFYTNKIPVPALQSSGRKKSWLVVSNGRFLTRSDPRLLSRAVEQVGSDVVAVTIAPNLRAGHERILADSQRDLFGFRLLYSDTIQPAPMPADWPHLMFIRPALFDRLFPGRTLPSAFSEFIDICNSNSAAIEGLNVGGTVLDLNTEEGLLSMLSAGVAKRHVFRKNTTNDVLLPVSSRLFGQVAFGKKVEIGNNTIIAGPTVICDGARVAESAVVGVSIIGPNVSVPPGCVIRGRVISDSRQILQQTGESLSVGLPDIAGGGSYRGSYRIWSRLSYARCVKRIADVIVASVVLLIFAPVLPVIAIVVKLSSRGPVFFKDVRQGLHGRFFACVKFRTMQVGADRLQEELREINVADGPQFVIPDDPRMSKVGRFLRETYIDEIPQFFAVLLGQMSVVGPRPSPESENVLCPFWRDARLSVRPGITGLWQVCRTRKPMRDFQEWIHYDIEYVRNLSPRLDLWICWRTFLKMAKNFIRQFQ